MHLPFHTPTALEYFAALVNDEDEPALLETAASLAQDEYPTLSTQQVLGEVDQLQARLLRRLPKSSDGRQKLHTLNHFFYHELNFCGHPNNFTDPDHSYIHVVLRTRLAAPIALAVIWLELAQGLGLRAQGLIFPNYFFVKVTLSQGQVVLDPLNGKSLSRAELIEHIGQPRSLTGLIDGQETRLERYLQAASARQIIERMLRNLKSLHAAQEDWPRLIQVQDRLLTLQPQAWAEYRDRGLAHARLHQHGCALADLETYLDNIGAASDRRSISQCAAELRQALH